MKIKDIVDFQNNIDIIESLDTKFDSIDWKTDGNQSIGTGIIDGQSYIIELSSGIIPINNNVMNFINVAFSILLDDGSDTTTFQNRTSNSSRVFGAISNAIQEQLPQMIKSNSVDFLVFAAKNDYDSQGNVFKNAERKIRSYKAMIKSNLHGLSNWSTALAELNIRDGRVIIAMRRRPTPQEWTEISQYFLSRGKQASLT